MAKARDNPLADVGPPTKEEKDNPTNSRIETYGGNTDYTLRRLARDNPELLDAIAVIAVMVGSAMSKVTSCHLG